MADTLLLISLISFIVAGVSFVVAVFLGIKFRIPKVIGDLTGRTARKSIAKMRESNERSGNKSYRPSAVNLQRGKVTETASDLRKAKAHGAQQAAAEQGQTGILEENRARGDRAEQTAKLENTTTELLLNDDKTELLMTNAAPQRNRIKKELRMLDEVLYTHTDEVIE